MAIGFRSTLFGFHRGDVLDYIEKVQRKYAGDRTAAEEKATAQQAEINRLQAEAESLREKQQDLEAQLNAFLEKQAEIDRLSERIKDLYRLAQTNAETICETADKTLQVSRREVTQNLNVIGEAHESLRQLRASLNETSDAFARQVSDLIASLGSTRETLADCDRLSDDTMDHFKASLSEIVS